MSKGGTLNHESHNRMLKGKHGYNAKYTAMYVYHNRRPPTQKQVDWVHDLVHALAKAGIDKSDLLSRSDWRTDDYACAKLIEVLRREANHCLEGGAPVSRCPEGVVYENLCKNNRTGERVKYLTTNRYAHPAGYEFLGELCRQYVSTAEAEKCPVIIHYCKSEVKAV